ncbi:hypothetical protein MLD38_032608 [Melastoma candidum]|uniref:Uncharacterized protein n=1 Tax=Melastoma candidum TaxID=119954 RepID=A0ACB9M5Y3_9MYRT|nr:hypothetical protein MLD38_032608 [Melastoma candidum]
MPLRRHQVRSEYHPLQADKDDPEALLESVSMAGLVVILRQLGDLSQFAAEIFHDLHEEVLATASRGHGLTALLSQTNHSSFFYSAGVDLHPSMHSQDNLIAQGELPRFIMDSYEECRGPPQLFFLDKFDVAGAGACLKRYTDPALFKGGTTLEDMHGERKIWRVKKKGMRGKNGETPEFVQMSHAKLHRLFLQERVEITNSNPSQVVNLKRRQFNDSSFFSNNGKSYMEKFVGSHSPSPDSKTVFEDPVACPTLQWASESNVPKAVEIHSVSPGETGSRLKNDASASNKQFFSEKSSFEKLDEMAFSEKVVESLPPPDEAAYESFDVREIELSGRAGKIENRVDGFHFDEITCEIENYVDAVTTLESEVDADGEFEAKASKRFAGKHDTDSITTEDQVEQQFQFSDAQSWDHSVSVDGYNFTRKGSSTFPYSDGQSNLIENILSDSEGFIGRAFPSSEAGNSECLFENEIPTRENMLQETSDKHMMPASLKDEANPLSSDRNGNSLPVSDRIIPDLRTLEGTNFRENNSANLSDVLSESREECLSGLTTGNHSTNVEEVEESSVSSDLLQHPSSLLNLLYVAESDNSCRRDAFNRDEDDELIYRKKCKNGLSFAEMYPEDQLYTSRLPEISDSSGFTLFHLISTASITADMDIDRPCYTAVSKDMPPVLEPNLEQFAAREYVRHIVSNEQDLSLSVDVPTNKQSADIDHCHDDEMKLDENLHASRAVDDERLAWKKQIDGYSISRYSCLTSSDDHLDRLNDVVMEPSAVDVISISYPEFLDPGPATFYGTEIELNENACSYDVTNQEKVSLGGQSSSKGDLEPQVDSEFDNDELMASLVISDSQGIGLPNMKSEDEPTSKTYLLSISKSNISSLDYQELDCGERSEYPPEFQADAPSAKCRYKDETISESVYHPSEQLQSSNFLFQEDILSVPVPPCESSLQLGYQKPDDVFLKDNEVTSKCSALLSDLESPKEDECNDTSRSCADDRWGQFPCSEPSDEPALTLVRHIKQDEALLSGVSTGVSLECMPPIFSVGSQVDSVKDGVPLDSSSAKVVYQSPAPDYMSQTGSVSLQTQVWNFITVVHHEDSEEKDSEQVFDPKTFEQIDEPDEQILPFLEEEKVQSTSLPVERLIDWSSGQLAASNFMGGLPVMGSESSLVLEGIEGMLVHRTFEAENGSLSGGSAQSETRRDEWLLDGPSLGEVASVSPPEGAIAEPIVSDITRPPKQLIEAVAAHDRTMLRKVTERIRPPIQSTVSERDSFLEQIRAKSFNLKPAVATRPSIQVPKQT